MKLGKLKIEFEKRVTLNFWSAALISIIAVVVALLAFCLIFFSAGVSPIDGYAKIFSYAFLNSQGLELTINRFIFLLFCTLAFILPRKAGFWNIGMAGQFYMGAIGAFTVPFFFPNLPSIIIVPLMIITAAIFGAAVGGVPG
ncbi:MAG: ABC transporter permease, partial [Hadesarchaea archaeon]|nr:ABC transporter permease [Hadesarchaea archaeon]